MVARFRVLRLSCRIRSGEVAAAANITPQRLSQIESLYYGKNKPKNPERFIRALEKIIAERKEEIAKVEYICKNKRDTIFDCVDSGERL